MSPGDTVRYFDREKRFRFGKVVRVGPKWVTVKTVFGEKRFRPQELRKWSA